MCLLLQAPELCSTATSPLKTHQEEQNQALTPPGKAPVAGVRSPSCSRQQASVRGARLHLPNAGASGMCGFFLTYFQATTSIQLIQRTASLMSHKEHTVSHIILGSTLAVSYLCLCSSAGRNLPRSLLGPTVGGDSEGGVFAVPTTLPPNSSRHNKMFSPNKEAELAFRQQLDSISVRHKNLKLVEQRRRLVCRSNMHVLISICMLLQMQSDLFPSRQRKPRNRQLRKPLVVQVREDQTGFFYLTHVVL